jgi:hypothetical protein
MSHVYVGVIISSLIDNAWYVIRHTYADVRPSEKLCVGWEG